MAFFAFGGRPVPDSYVVYSLIGANVAVFLGWHTCVPTIAAWCDCVSVVFNAFLIGCSVCLVGWLSVGSTG